jgi:type I restriction enzyme S subunit
MNQSIDLDVKYLDLIESIFHEENLSNARVFFFGSRTTGQAKPFSDIDILIDAGKPLSLAQLASLNSKFDEALIPFKVDIADAYAINRGFSQAIRDQLILFKLNTKKTKQP